MLILKQQRKGNKMKKVNKKYVFAYITEEQHQKLREYCAKKKTTTIKLISEFLDKKLK